MNIPITDRTEEARHPEWTAIDYLNGTTGDYRLYHEGRWIPPTQTSHTVQWLMDHDDPPLGSGAQYREDVEHDALYAVGVGCFTLLALVLLFVLYFSGWLR